MKLEELKFIDLFAGIGGFRQALEHYKMTCVFSSELDKYCCETYYENFDEYPLGDITKIDENIIPDHDILCAGFPCQPFSISGKQLGFDDSRGTLFFDIIRIIKAKKPQILFLENVGNLAKHNDSRTVQLMISLLESEGYIVYIKELNACDYGVPQSRKRLYFVGFRNKNILFKFPKPFETFMTVKDILDNDNIDSSYIIKKDNMSINYDKTLNSRTKKINRIGTINKGGQGDRIYDINGLGITLSAHGGGNASKTGAYLINGSIRKLTPRECARMQGFPDTFIINRNKNQAYKQFGNSVAIPVLKAIINQVKIAIEPRYCLIAKGIDELLE